MISNRTLTLAACAAALAITTACTEDIVVTPQSTTRTPMTFSTYLPRHTRGIVPVADISTLATDGFNLYATYDVEGTANVLLNEKFSVDEATGLCTSTSGEQPYWPSDKSATVSFIATYPSNYFAEGNLAKNGDEQYELTIETAGNKDVVVACATQSEANSSEGHIELTFKHVMAQAVLKVSSVEAADYNITLTAANLIDVPTSSTLNCSTGEIVANADEKTSFFFINETAEIAAESEVVGSVMVPAGSEDTQMRLALTYVYDYGDDVVRTYKDTADVTLVAGYQTNINATLSGDMPLVVSGAIGGWTKNENGYVIEANGHDYVDLGLPSGTLWATCNVGAENPEDYGDYYAWGETSPHYSVNDADTIWLDVDDYSGGYAWSLYGHCDGTNNTLTKYCNNGEYGTEDYKSVLDAEDDAATANWGSGWRMPTQAEWVELINSEYTTTE